MAGSVFIAGATGYTGREVVRECVARGLETVAHVRPDSGRLEHWRSHFEALGARVDTSAWELGAITATLEALAPTQVYALLGTTKKRGKGGGSSSAVNDTYEAVDYGLSVLLLEAAVACGSAPRFVYLSALGADGRAANAYMGVRKRVEAAVRGSGLPFLFARPVWVTGGRDEQRTGERIGAAVTNGALGLIRALGGGELADRYTTLTGAELAAGMVALACTRSDPGIIAGPAELVSAS